MKKLTLFLSVLLAMAVFAFAAGAEPVNYTANEDGSFDVTYTGTAGEYYALVIVEGIADEGAAPVITSSSIQYIDQVTAGADGTAAFNKILLKTDGVQGTVYLGGSDLAAAKLLGYVNKTSDEKFTVSGTVTSESAVEANVTLTSTTDETKVFTVTTASGEYTISVPADTYKFVVTKNAHFSYTKKALEVAADIVKDVTLVGGDVNADNTIDIIDLGKLLNAYNSSSDLSADINGDGAIDVIDLGKLLNNYNAVATVE